MVYNAIVGGTTVATLGAIIMAGNQFIIPDTNTTTTPGIYLRDEIIPIKTWPLTLGTEFCEGHSGALLCTVTLKLTGSGGKREYNAGSYLCGTSTCSIVETRVFTESGADALYGGWTPTPLTGSASQLFNNKRAKNGFTLIGSGAYSVGNADAGTYTTVTKDVPPGNTIKFTWAQGNGTEDYSQTRAAAVIRFWKYYTP